MKVFSNIVLFVSVLAVTACGNDTQTDSSAAAAVDAQLPAADRVYIVSPANGATVTSPVKVVFGVEGKVIAPAGQNVPNSGHHHLLIDLEELPAFELPIPNDDQHRHFGGGQTEAEVALSPGPHTLQLLLGDMNHVPHNPPLLSEKISITVVD